MPSSVTVPLVLRSADSVLSANRPFTEVFGATIAELGESPLLDWIHPDDREHLARALAAGVGCLTARHRTRDGEWLALDWRIRTDAGEVVALGRLLAERAKTDAQGSGEEAEPRVSLSQTLEAMALIVEAKNPGMRCSVLLVNQEDQSISVGAGPSFPEEYNQAVEGLRIGPAVGSCGTAAFWNIPVIVENIQEDPLWKDLRDAAAMADVSACWSYPIAGANGDVLGAMALYDRLPTTPTPNQLDGLEIAARMVGLAVEGARYEEQLRHIAKIEAIGVLAGGVAHDFNNLLAAILGNAELILQGSDHAAGTTRSLDAIITASLRARELCDQMLTYAGRSTLRREVLECNALMQELGALLSVTLSKKATLEFDLNSAPLGLLADPSQLGQVIMNLITNASESLGNEPGCITLTTAARSFEGLEDELLRANTKLPAGEYVCIEIEDTGKGMSAATQRRIFDPFFTTKSVGRGLGLAAVQGIVSGHRGAIILDSELGRGTKVTVLLPRVQLEEGAPAPAPTEPAAPTGARILVADDEPSVLAVVVKMLERAGYRVTPSADGLEALELFGATPLEFDCVLLDLSMPRLDGIETMRELLALRPDLRVILTSGFSEQDILQRIEGARPVGILCKPTTKQRLLQTVAEALA
ncbi:MAG: response regulator [Planctomycetota bacterium]|nr:response regulator [Planctomycetota bacterium]